MTFNELLNSDILLIYKYSLDTSHRLHTDPSQNPLQTSPRGGRPASPPTPPYRTERKGYGVKNRKVCFDNIKEMLS